MNYSELMQTVFDAFYTCGKDFPQNLLYPILGRRENGLVVDRFIECRIERNRSNGAILHIEGPMSIYEHVENNELQSYFIGEEDYKSNADADIGVFSTINIDIENFKMSDFPQLYMAVRGFAFSNELDTNQCAILKKLVAFYTIIVEREIKPFYLNCGKEFFGWAHQLLDGNK